MVKRKTKLEATAAKLKKKYPGRWRFVVEQCSNLYDNSRTEEVWDVVAYNAAGDESVQIAECGAVKCDGTKEIAEFIAAALNVFVGEK